MRQFYEELTSPEVVRELRLPEGLSIEYKGEVPRTKSLGKDCCAFANTNGGLVVIGVKDPPQEGAAPTEFPGVPATPDPVKRVDGMLANSIVPSIEYESKPIYFQDNGEKRCYVVLWVEPSGELHQLSVEDVGTCYRRAGRNSVPMGPDELRHRIEAISRSSRQLEVRIEERISNISGDRAFVYTVIAPYAPFGGPVLDPSDPSFRQQITEHMRILTSAREVVPYSQGCQSVSPVEDAFARVSVSRNGYCEFADGQVMNVTAAFSFWHEALFHQYSHDFVNSVPMDSNDKDTLGNRLMVDYMIERLAHFLDLCVIAFRLLGYEGKLQVRTLLVPAKDKPLVLRIPDQDFEREKMIADERVSVEVRRSVLEVERQKVDTIQDLVLKIFQTFGSDGLSADAKYAFDTLIR